MPFVPTSVVDIVPPTTPASMVFVIKYCTYCRVTAPATCDAPVKVFPLVVTAAVDIQCATCIIAPVVCVTVPPVIAWFVGAAVVACDELAPLTVKDLISLGDLNIIRIIADPAAPPFKLAVPAIVVVPGTSADVNILYADCIPTPTVEADTDWAIKVKPVGRVVLVLKVAACEVCP